MCLLLLALNAVPQRPWLLLGNRDEFHARATAVAAEWTDHPDVYGGRDLVAGGSWLALNHNGRFAAVTNVRIGLAKPAPRSRGDLVADFVIGSQPPNDYIATIADRIDEYGPFNLIVGDADAVWGLSSTTRKPWRYSNGVHVLSNGPPTEDWPKMRTIRTRFETAIAKNRIDDPSFEGTLLDLLLDDQTPDDDDLPETGVGIALERVLAPIFIRGTTYGTRAGTLAHCDRDGQLTLIERTFGPDGTQLGEQLISI